MSRVRGLVMINTGDGKGKTTAALGMLFRAWGHNKKVIMMQFIKNSAANYGEHRAARRIGVEIVAHGAGFINQGNNAEKNKQLSIELWDMATEKIGSGDYHMVILDELTYPLRYGWLSTEDVIDVIRNRPREVHIVITGREAPQELIDFADMVVEMRDVKHHLREGIKAQPGVEF